MALPAINGLSICGGIGGLELGLRFALGPRYRCVGYVERDAFAAACLVARMESEDLDPTPIWDDVATFDGRAWRGAVDIVSAGFPCQPWSQAGKRRGTADARWLWPLVAECIREIRPAVVVLENVSGLVAAGLGHVLGDLARLGFDAEWDVFLASETGAPQLRERWFCLAYAEGCGCEILSGMGAKDGFRRAPGCYPALAFPPPPNDAAGWNRYLAAGGPEPCIRRGSDGTANRVDRLRCLGNSVVQAQAALAFEELCRRALA